MPAGRKKKPPGKVVISFSVVVFAVLILLPIFAFGVAPPLENNVLTTWRCDVTSAEPRESWSGLRGSSTLPSVLLPTTDCGEIVLHEGVTFENSAAIAAAIPPGVYDFQVGWVSAHIIALIPNGLPTAHAYELVP